MKWKPSAGGGDTWGSLAWVSPVWLFNSRLAAVDMVLLSVLTSWSGHRAQF